jgi:hypothetical protein
MRNILNRDELSDSLNEPLKCYRGLILEEKNEETGKGLLNKKRYSEDSL